MTRDSFAQLWLDLKHPVLWIGITCLAAFAAGLLFSLPLLDRVLP